MKNILFIFKKIILAVLILPSVLFLLLSPVAVLAQSNSFIPSKQTICGGTCPLIDADFNFTTEGLAKFILSLARFLTYLGGALAVLFIVYGGFLIITDFGNGERAKAGWSCIRSSFVGLVIIIVAYTAVGLIGSILNGSDIADTFFNGVN